MEHINPIGLVKWHQYVREHDRQALAEALADNIVFRSPFVWRPREGRELATLYLTSAIQVFSDFTYQREFFNENGAVLEFAARVGELSVKGVDILQFDADGRISDFEVMVRPGNGLQALAAAMTPLVTTQPPTT